MIFFKQNILSNQVIASRSDKLAKRALRNAKKNIKKGMLIDGHSLALHLPDIDSKFNPIKADITNATLVRNYANVCASKMAETRQMIASYNQGFIKLNRMSQAVANKAKAAGRADDFVHDNLAALDITELTNKFDAIIREEDENDKK